MFQHFPLAVRFLQQGSPTLMLRVWVWLPIPLPASEGLKAGSHHYRYKRPFDTFFQYGILPSTISRVIQSRDCVSYLPEVKPLDLSGGDDSPSARRRRRRGTRMTLLSSVCQVSSLVAASSSQDSIALVSSFIFFVPLGLFPSSAPITDILVCFQEEMEINENAQSALFTQKSLTAL